MTQNAENTEAKSARPDTGGRAPKPWWRRPWMIPLWLVIVGYLVYQVHPFANLDESTAPMPPHEGFPAYYPLLMVHILAGTIAMLLVGLQVWPWLRQHHPAVHRTCGWIYLGAALTNGTIGLIIVRFAPLPGQVGVSMAVLVWMTTTVAAVVMARRRRFALHRRFALYSFAIVMNNVWGVIIVNVGLHLPFDIPLGNLLEAARWVGWVGNLVLVQWWLYRTANRPLALGRARAAVNA